MKTLFIIIYLLCFIYPASSQSGWISQNSSTTENLNKVFFHDALKGWIAGNGGKVLRTSDGGDTWELQTLPTNQNFYSVFFIDENTGWVAGGLYDILPSRVLFKTTNGGLNWISIEQLGGSVYLDVFFLNPNTGFLSGDLQWNFVSAGFIKKTFNGGFNWNNSFQELIIVSSLEFKNDSAGWASAYSTSDVGPDSIFILSTSNSGISWIKTFAFHGPEVFYPNDIEVIGSKIFTVGNSPNILYSSDSGNSWNFQTSVPCNNKNTIFFIDENTGWIGGSDISDSNRILKSTDGGNSWFNLRTPAVGINSIQFENHLTGWAVGNGGVILKTITGGATDINIINNEIPDQYYLYQNFPNPFNPSTNIKFAMPKSGKAELKVFDAVGREVSVLLNENLSAGSYEYTFDAAGLPSGIYFYRLRTGEFVASRKMLLVK